MAKQNNMVGAITDYEGFHSGLHTAIAIYLQIQFGCFPFQKTVESPPTPNASRNPWFAETIVENETVVAKK